MSENQPLQWNFPVVRAGLSVLGIAADLTKVTADAVSAGAKAYSAGIKEVQPPSLGLGPKPKPA
jgi:hypothetical protein